VLPSDKTQSKVLQLLKNVISMQQKSQERGGMSEDLRLSQLCLTLKELSK